MIFNCFYDENMEYADVVYIPDEIGKKILRVQNEFFSWIFDKNNNHEYWIIVNGEKRACRYGTQAFIDWINEVYWQQDNDKAYIITENTTSWDNTNDNIVF